MAQQKITINDIARLAGVSKRTVSRVINRSPKVGEKTKINVERIIAEQNYVPDKQARGLASRRSYLIGLVYDNQDALFINEAQRGILACCGQKGYELVVHPCQYKSDNFNQDVLNFIQRSKLDGIVILPPASEIDDLAIELDKHDIHYVRLVSGHTENTENFVMSNDRHGAADMARFLVSQQHQKIAMITGPLNYRSSKERYEGFTQTLQAINHELPKHYVKEGNNSYQSGMLAAQHLLTLADRPTAIFANNDEMASGVLKVAYELGLKVPDQLSICGFDDNLLAARLIPALTTIKRPVQKMAEIAAHKLIAKVENNNQEIISKNYTIQPELISRESTGAAPK